MKGFSSHCWRKSNLATEPPEYSHIKAAALQQWWGGGRGVGRGGRVGAKPERARASTTGEEEKISVLLKNTERSQRTAAACYHRIFLAGWRLSLCSGELRTVVRGGAVWHASTIHSYSGVSEELTRLLTCFCLHPGSDDEKALCLRDWDSRKHWRENAHFWGRCRI